jgi:hypothetical protein
LQSTAGDNEIESSDSSIPTTEVIVSTPDGNKLESMDSSVPAAEITMSSVSNNDNVENIIANSQPLLAASKAGAGSLKLPLNLKAVPSDREKSVPFKNSEQRKKSARLSSVQDDKDKKTSKHDEVSPF